MMSLYESETHLTDVGTLLWSHKQKMLLVFLVGMTTTVVLLSLSRQRFQSEAKILVRAEGMNLDPTVTTGQFVAFDRSDESEVHAVQELLSSRALAEQVVQQLGADQILNEPADSAEQVPSDQPVVERRVGGRLGLRLFGNSNTRDQAVRQLSEDLSVSAGKLSNVITISCEADDPQLAQKILEQLLQQAQQQYVRIHQTEGSQAFLSAQMDMYKSKLEHLEEQLRDLKNRTGLSSLATQRDTHLQLIGSLTQSLVLAQTELEAAQAEARERQQRLEHLPEMVVTEQTSGQPQNAGQGLREKLYELEITEQELASRFTDQHPQLVQVRRKIDEARRIAQAEPAAPQTVRATNLTRQSAELALQEREAIVSALQARIESLRQKIDTTTEELAKINSAEVEMSRLERDIELAQANHRKYAESVEQARINQELETAKISRLNVMQAPTLVLTPISPRPKLALAMGGVLSLLASCGAALLAQQLRQPDFRGSTARLQSLDAPASLPDPAAPLPRRMAVAATHPR